MRTTVGPLSPEVYWRRRLAILGVLVVTFVGVRACAGGDASQADRQTARPASPATAAASPDGTVAHPYRPVIGQPSPTPSASAAAVASARPVTGPCTNSELLLTASTSTRVYTVGSKPTLSMTVRNISKRTCARDVGPISRELIITSGDAHTWSTDDCHAGAASAVVTLKPGASQTFTEIWDGRRSQAKCAGSRPVASAGTYRVYARIGTLLSDTYLFRLT